MYVDTNVPVLVNEDTIYRREDHSRRLLLYGRPQIGVYYPPLWRPTPISAYLSNDNWTEQVPRHPPSPEAAIYPFRQIPVTQPSGQPFALIYPPRPKPFLFEDRFVSVYSVTTAIDQIATTYFTPPQPMWLYFSVNRPRPEFFDDHFLDSGQTNHPFPNQNTAAYSFGIMPYTFEVPDLNDNPWIEQVARPKSVEALLYPHRQIPQFLPGQPWNLLWWNSQNAKPEAENFPRFTDNQSLMQFRWQSVVQPLPPYVVTLPARTRSAWTADSAVVTADSINFTCDGADLINNGGTSIKENVPGVSSNKLAYSVSIPLFVTYKGGT